MVCRVMVHSASFCPTYITRDIGSRPQHPKNMLEEQREFVDGTDVVKRATEKAPSGQHRKTWENPHDNLTLMSGFSKRKSSTTVSRDMFSTTKW